MKTLRWLAWAVAIVAPPAFGVTIEFATVGDPGNAPEPASGWGAVSNVFQISKYETTNAQYVEFLNSVDAAGVHPNGVYDTSMGSDALGGIVFNAGAAGGRKYSVKSGTNPNGAVFGNAPVVFTTWFSAARFVNWLGNGQQASAASMEDGTYTLANRTTGAMVTRNPTAGFQVALPSRDEWFKSACYDGSRYVTLRGTNTITQVWLPDAANFGGAATPTFGPLAVGTYANNRSPYGLYDVLGNVTEYTDTADTGRAMVLGTEDAGRVDRRLAWLGAAHAPSPDVRGCPRGIHSLGCRRRFAILAPLGDIRRLPAHGQPRAEFMPGLRGIERRVPIRQWLRRGGRQSSRRALIAR